MHDIDRTYFALCLKTLRVQYNALVELKERVLELEEEKKGFDKLAACVKMCKEEIIVK